MKIHAFLLSLLFALASSTDAGARPLDYQDVFGLEYADSPALSPNGDQVAYVRRHMDSQTDRNLGQIWLIDLDAGQQQPLTGGDGSFSSPAWSPDGRRLAFIGNDGDGDSQLHVLWLDSGRMTEITDGPHSPSAASWSPDGTRIAFNRFVPTEPPRLVKPLKAPEGANWAPAPTVIDRPVFRVDGQGFLPHGQTQRFVVPADGGPPRQVTNGPYPNSGPAAWTADGKALVFAAVRRDDWELEGRDTELYRFDLESGDLSPVTDRYGPDESPAISPDGRRLAWLGFDDELMSYTNTEVWLMPLDGGEPENLTGDLDRNVDALAWAEDGKSLYIAYSDAGTGVIERRSARRLTSMNAELLANRQLARVEEIKYPSSLDGLEIEGWVAYPPDFEAGQRYPLIIEIHGGPFADYGPRFSMEVQLIAAQGY